MIVTDVKTKIPEGWQQNKLSYFAALAGKRYPKNAIPYLEIGDVDVISKSYKLKEKSAPGVCLAVEYGDVLISKVRPTRGAIVSVKDNLYTSPAFSVLRASNDKKYLFYALSRQNFVNYLGIRETGTTYPSCDDGDILDYKTIFPQDPKEQQKIAEVLTMVDEAIEKTDAIIEKNKLIKQGLMQDLFQYGIDEHGNIRSEKTHKFKIVKIGNKEMRIPEEWEFTRLDELCERIIVGLATSVTKYYRTSGIPILRNQNIRKGYFDGSDMLYLDPKFANQYPNKKCRKNDVLICHTGSNVGDTCLLTDEFIDAQTFTTLIVSTKKQELDPEFFVNYMNYEIGIKELNNILVGGGKDNLNVGQLIHLRVVRPVDINEQTRISLVLSIINKTIDEDQVYKQKLQSLKRGLMEDLLTGKVRVNSLITN